MSSDVTFETILTEARSFKFYTDKPVEEEKLRALYEMAKLAPSASTLPDAHHVCDVGRGQGQGS